MGLGSLREERMMDGEEVEVNRGSLILISFVIFHPFSNIRLCFHFVLFSFLSLHFIWTFTIDYNTMVPEGSGQTKEEDLARMEDETLWRVEENMGWVPRICT